MSETAKSMTSDLSSAKQTLLRERLKRISARQGPGAPLIRRRKPDSPAPLSPAQQRLWFLEQYEPGNALYNVCQGFWIEGSLQPGILRAAWVQIVRRHLVLRCVFAAERGSPVQSPAPHIKGDLALVDLSGLPRQRARQCSLRLARQESARPFDLHNGPAFRLSLLKLSEDLHLLLANFHHIVFDGASMEILCRELQVLYDAAETGMQPLLPELPLQYADYAAWQQERLKSGDWQSGLDFWRTQFGGRLPALELPFDRPRLAARNRRAGYQRLFLPTSLSQSLRSFGKRCGATPFMIFMTAFQALLMRYSGQKRVIVGTPVDNRDLDGLERLIGFFVNTLALPSSVAAVEATFEALLQQVRQVSVEAFRHKELPFDRVVEELHPQRALDHHPVYQVMLGYKSRPSPLPRLHGLKVSKADVLGAFAKYDLTWIIEDSPSAIETLIEYDTDLFDGATVQRMLGHLGRLLLQAARRPQQRLAELSLLSAAEEHQILDWGSNRAHLEEDSLKRLFEAQALAAPERAALVSAGGRLTLSYAWLNAAANGWASMLRRQGAGPETRLALCMKRSPQMVVGLIAAVKSGAAYVSLDPQDPVVRLHMMLQDCRAGLLIADPQVDLPEFEGKRLEASSLWGSIGKEPSGNPRAGTLAGNLLYLMYTSGSTGRPKGVAVVHRAAARLTRSADYAQLKPGDRVAHASNVAFDASTFEVWGALLNGAALVEVEQQAVLSPQALGLRLQQCSVTALFLTTALFNQVAQDHPSAFRSLEHLLFGGEAVDPERVRRVLQAEPPRRLLHVYGPTECTTFASWQRVVQVAQGARTVPIGRPLANSEAYVLDGEMKLVPAGVAGELCIGGPGLARGYWQSPSETASRFVPHPLAQVPGERLYRSGDRVRWLPAGSLEFLGRLDGQIKLRGFRIEAGEIESLLRKHPAVSEAAVATQPDPAGSLRLVAYLVASPSQQGQDSQSSLQDFALRRFLRQRLPDYMVPAFFVLLPELPLTSNGKLDRHALPAPGRGNSLQQPSAAPSTPLQARLVQIWMEVLKVESVGVQDDFFHLGGHSLLASRLISRIRQELSFELPLKSLFRSPTVAGLADEIGAASLPSPPPPLRAADRARSLPLSFGQQRLWFLDRLQPGNPFYNVPAAWRLRGRLQHPILEGSLRELQRRHESLRTHFPSRYGDPAQDILPEADLRLSIIDLQGLPQRHRETEARRCIRHEARRPFKLAQGPVFRAALIAWQAEEDAATQDDGILLLTMHHIVSDGWSLDILRKELEAVYSAWAQGRPHALPDLPLQYADYASWQREWMQGEVLDEQLRCWTRRLQGVALLELPADRPRPRVQTFRGRRHSFRIPHSTAQSLAQLGRRQGTTLFMTALAAFQTLLHRYSGKCDIVTGTPVANRGQPGTETMIGFFANSLALRSDLRGDPTFLELLRRVSETCLEAFSHQEIPFERLVEHLQPERDLGRSPIFQVVFAVQNVPSQDLRLAGLSVEAFPVDSTTTRFDLELHLRERAEDLEGILFFDLDLFDPPTILRLQRHFVRLLGSLASKPEQRLSQACFLSPQQRFQLLAEWNDTDRELPSAPLIHQLFEQVAADVADASAAVYGDGWVSYRELDRRAGILSDRLRLAGVEQESVVAVRLPASLELTIALLAILKAGGAYLPIDRESPQERVDFMLNDSQAALHLASRGDEEDLYCNLPTLHAEECFQPLQAQDSPARIEQSHPLRLAYVIYTSGSTGRPKGVAVPHKAVVRLVRNTDYVRLSSGDRVCQISNSSFDAATFEFWGALLHGGRLVGVSRQTALAPAQLAGELHRKQVSALFLTTTLFNQVVQAAPGAFGCVEHLLFGGEAADPVWVGRLLDEAPPRRLLNVYGPTETTTFASWHRITDWGGRDAVPIGRPIANASLLVLDRHLQPVPALVCGELFIGGEGLARGYLGSPALSAQRFIPHPWCGKPGQRLYRSGDWVRRLADGTILFLGRIDRQVKVRGYRIEPGEIEAVLSEYPTLRQAAVIDLPDPSGGRRLAAYVACDAPSRHLDEELRSYLLERLPAFMAPAFFIPLDSLPLTPSGKLDRRALPQADLPVHPHTPEIPPETELERRLAGIWEEVLQRKRVGVLDNFFDLGGHSLLVTRVQGRLQNDWKIEVPIIELFLHPTVRSLADFLAKERLQADAQPRTFDKARQRARRQVQAIRQRQRRRSRKV